MSEFIVREVGGIWAVVNNGVIDARRATPPEAIGKAVALAASAAQHDPAAVKRVIYEPADGESRVVWDSEKDGFSAE